MTLVPVLPCDREAAASMFLYLRGEEKPNDVHADCIRDGQSDDDELVIAWARHRLAALEAAAKVAENRAPAVQCMSVEPVVAACLDIATAIRALSNKTGEGKTGCPTCGGPSPDTDDCLTCARWWRDNPPPADPAFNKGGRDGE